MDLLELFLLPRLRRLPSLLLPLELLLSVLVVVVRNALRKGVSFSVASSMLTRSSTTSLSIWSWASLKWEAVWKVRLLWLRNNLKRKYGTTYSRIQPQWLIEWGGLVSLDCVFVAIVICVVECWISLNVVFFPFLWDECVGGGESQSKSSKLIMCEAILFAFNPKLLLRSERIVFALSSKIPASKAQESSARGIVDDLRALHSCKAGHDWRNEKTSLTRLTSHHSSYFSLLSLAFPSPPSPRVVAPK